MCVCVYMCIYVYVYVYVYMCVCVQIFYVFSIIHEYSGLDNGHKDGNMCMCVYTYMHSHATTHTHTHTHTHANTYEQFTCTHKHKPTIHAHIHTYIHTFKYSGTSIYSVTHYSEHPNRHGIAIVCLVVFVPFCYWGMVYWGQIVDCCCFAGDATSAKDEIELEEAAKEVKEEEI